MKLPGLDDADVGLSGTLGSAAKYLWAAGLLACMYDTTILKIQIIINTHNYSWSKFNNDWHNGRTICH